MADFFKIYDCILQKKNCYIRPVNAETFTESFTSCDGIVCGAGFETAAEALHMGKKVFGDTNEMLVRTALQCSRCCRVGCTCNKKSKEKTHSQSRKLAIQ